jgi:hypothetical protein
MKVLSVGAVSSVEPRRPCAWRRWASVSLSCGLAFWLLACGPDHTGSSLEVETGAAGAAGSESRHISATWTFRSTEVDVDVILTTNESSQSCVTTGELVTDEALAPIERYVLEETHCATLRLTVDGDIVLFGEATGYDWSDEHIGVDTGRETIELGPCIPPGSSSPARFTLSAPDCGNDCSCAKLTRRWGTEVVTLPLGKKCG